MKTHLRILLRLTLSLSLSLSLVSVGHAQLFGQNKPRYRSFDFNVLNTPHFAIYHYTENDLALQYMADWSEQWYRMHTDIFQDTFPALNPLIFYNDHAEFQQTNAIFGEVGVGTGGVTEGFKNRVVMPFTMINQQTQQVLGHEMVHAFQFNDIIGGDSTSLESLANLPLWMVEGMAEYMSLGRVDPFTAMWMRDAVINDDVPNIKKLFSFKYFPYRYGQAFWAFFSGTYGDHLMKPLFTNTAKYGIDAALDLTLNTNQEDLGALFTESLKTYYAPYVGEDKKENFIGKKIISDENAGRLNVSPVVSPDGKYVIFLSDKNLFSTDLYLADARDGKILRKVNSLIRDGNIDDFSYLESAGTWSPDSKQFAFIAFSKGRNIILIKDPATGSTEDEISIPKVTAIAHPTWSPDGKEIAFSGMVEGQTDLFIYNLKTKKTRQLTDDFYSEVYPDYSPDGQYLIFSSDRKTFDQQKVHGRWSLHLSRIRVQDQTITDYDFIFPGADCFNPCYDPDGKVYFISDRDGYRNLYRYDLEEELLQMTDLKTGISGIGRYSPAISVSKSGDRISFTHYFKSGYDIYQAKADRFLMKPVYPDDVDFTAGTLPVMLDENHQVVMENIEAMDETQPNLSSAYTNAPYKSNFKLDYITSSGFGISTGGIGARTGLAGGVSLIFSDILGNNQLFTTVALNGEIYDIGGAVQYINQKGRLAWGFTASHIPQRAGFYDQPRLDTLTDGGGGSFEVITQDEYILRLFEDQIAALVQYPFSKSLRLEGNLGFNYRFFRLDKRELYYSPVTLSYIGESNRERVPLEDIGLNYDIRKKPYYNNYIALVGDNSRFGLTSPLDGYRFRFDFTNYFGGYKYQTAMADIRLYHYKKPVSFAFRALHYTTLGPDSRVFYPILIGEMGLVHGFNYGRLSEYQSKNNITPAQLSGSKILLGNFEVRLPFTGPERLALIKSQYLFSDLAVFFDGGVAFNDYSELGDNIPEGALKPKLVFSTGVLARVNLFGALIVEPYFAWPLLKESEGRFGIFLVPGW